MQFLLVVIVAVDHIFGINAEHDLLSFLAIQLAGLLCSIDLKMLKILGLEDFLIEESLAVSVGQCHGCVPLLS